MENRFIGLLLSLIATIILSCSCQKDLVAYHSGDLKISVETGEEWKHSFDLFLGLKKQNPPQIAIWAEDLNGKFLSSIYVSHKIATKSWQGAGSNPRKEALPYYSYKARVQIDGASGATNISAIPDGVSGATPVGDFEVKLKPISQLTRFVIRAEFNHSTDFNDYYPKSAEEGAPDYSGGKEGSGQPAVVYEAIVDLGSAQKEVKAKLIGHSSPDGSNGELYTDLSSLTSAVNIVKEITIKKQE